MLDYAANGVRYWPRSELQASLVKTQEDMRNDPEAQVRRLLGGPLATVDGFFESATET
jgi:hypothetical protein